MGGRSSDWDRRRSPRISAALEDASSWKLLHNHHHPQQTTTNNNRMTTSIKRRKFNNNNTDFASTPSVSRLGKQVWKGRDSPHNEDQSTHDFVEWRCGRNESQMVNENKKHCHPAASTINDGKTLIMMPAKNILELVLDTLQRRDAYEIFAEPVDPDEVEEYYEIIKEPMDFGTMRAKLQEGMYKTLEQFEHDVFLIPENAMHFNSSATLYFRQARAIHELARRVFDDLKLDVDKFVMEYSGTRRRSTRKALLSESKEHSRSICIPKSGSRICSSNGTLNYRRTIKKNHPAGPPPTGISSHFLTAGNRYGGSSNNFKAEDRRSTYLKWMPSSLYNHKDCIRLVQMVEGDIRPYRESLMSFVKDLGPIAQMVAKRKLLGGQQQPQQHDESNLTQKKLPPGVKHVMITPANSNSNGKTAATFRTFRDFASSSSGGPHPSFLKMSSSSSNVIDLTHEDGGREEANGKNDGIGKEKSEEKEKMKRNRTVTFATTETTTTKHEGRVEGSTSRTQKRSETRTKRRRRRRRRRKTATSPDDDGDDDDDNMRPVILALENCHHHSTTTFPEFKPRNKKSSCAPPPMTEPPRDQAFGERNKEAMSILPQFTFDLPFLKARLNQMNLIPISKSSPFAAPSGSSGGELNYQKGADWTRSYPPSNPNFLNGGRTQSIVLDTNLALGL